MSDYFLVQINDNVPEAAWYKAGEVYMVHQYYSERIREYFYKVAEHPFNYPLFINRRKDMLDRYEDNRLSIKVHNAKINFDKNAHSNNEFRALLTEDVMLNAPTGQN